MQHPTLFSAPGWTCPSGAKTAGTKKPPKRWFLSAFAYPKAKSALELTPNQVAWEEIVDEFDSSIKA
jgi:hypothetical protein